MGARRKIFHKRFARVSPVFAMRSATVLLALASSVRGALPCFAGEGSGTANTNVKRQAASAQFARAEELRAALNEKAANKRSLAEYKQVVSTYHRVYLITPHAPEVPESLAAVGELYVEMGERFGRSYYQSAVDSYRFLIHEYPTSKFGQDAMLKVAELEKDQLGDPRAASKLYDEFLKKYPRSPRRREAQEARAELALVLNAEAPAMAKNAPAIRQMQRRRTLKAPKSDEPAELARSTMDEAPLPPASSSGGAPRVRRITTKASAESTRVTIDLEDTVQYSSARIRNPDRIFFDIHAARLTPEVAKANVRVEGDLLTAVRAAQNHAGIVRVVLDVNGVKDYTATLQDNPPELIIDLYPNTEDVRGPANSTRQARAGPCTQRLTGRRRYRRSSRQSASEDGVVDVARVVPDERSGIQPAAVEPQPPAAASLPPSLVRGAASNGSGSRSKSLKSSTTKPDLIQPSSVPAPTRDGQVDAYARLWD